MLDDTVKETPAALVSTLYEELRKLAHARLQHLPPGQTLQTTDLVHEAYIRLVADQNDWNGRRHFFGAAAVAMRDILVDRIRHNRAKKRGGDQVRVDLSVTLPDARAPLSDEEALSLYQALERLEKAQPEEAELVLLHCFAGLPLPEVAELMHVPLRTAERRWRTARAFLYMQMSGGQEQA